MVQQCPLKYRNLDEGCEVLIPGGCCKLRILPNLKDDMLHYIWACTISYDSLTMVYM